MAKRKIDKVDEIDVSDVVSVLDNAKVRGIVTELSPVKLPFQNINKFVFFHLKHFQLSI